MIQEKLKYISVVDRDEIKTFTDYEKNKELIDSMSGFDNLDFPFKSAEVSEYVIKITLNDDRCVYLPVAISDGMGLQADGLHRPKTKIELAEDEAMALKKAKILQNARKKQAEGKAHDDRQAVTQ